MLRVYFHGSVQDCSISSALAMEILQFCTKPSICKWRMSLTLYMLSQALQYRLNNCVTNGCLILFIKYRKVYAHSILVCFALLNSFTYTHRGYVPGIRVGGAALKKMVNILRTSQRAEYVTMAKQSSMKQRLSFVMSCKSAPRINLNMPSNQCRNSYC